MKGTEVKSVMNFLGIKMTVMAAYIGMDNANLDKLLQSENDLPASKEPKIREFLSIGAERLTEVLSKNV